MFKFNESGERNKPLLEIIQKVLQEVRWNDGHIYVTKKKLALD